MSRPEQKSSDKFLIINADDFGLSPGISDGIIQAFKKQAITSTSVLINSQGCEKSAEALKRNAPGLGIGLHLNLTLGRPISDPSNIPSLIGANGAFADLQEFGLRHSQIQESEIFFEFNAQIDRFFSVYGTWPDHLDTHHLLTCFHPGCAESVLKLSSKYDLPIRNFDCSTIAGVHDWIGSLKKFGASSQPLPDKNELSAVLRRYPNPSWPDYFKWNFFGEAVSIETLVEIIEKLPFGITELMCHPGLADDFSELYDGSMRQAEYDVLTSAEVKETIQRQGVILTNFSQLKMIQ